MLIFALFPVFCEKLIYPPPLLARIFTIGLGGYSIEAEPGVDTWEGPTMLPSHAAANSCLCGAKKAENGSKLTRKVSKTMSNGLQTGHTIVQLWADEVA